MFSIYIFQHGGQSSYLCAWLTLIALWTSAHIEHGAGARLSIDFRIRRLAAAGTSWRCGHGAAETTAQECALYGRLGAGVAGGATAVIDVWRLGQMRQYLVSLILEQP